MCIWFCLTSTFVMFLGSHGLVGLLPEVQTVEIFVAVCLSSCWSTRCASNTHYACVVTADPRNLEHLLEIKFGNFPRGPYIWGSVRDLLGDNIFGATIGTKWNHNAGRAYMAHSYMLACGGPTCQTHAGTMARGWDCVRASFDCSRLPTCDDMATYSVVLTCFAWIMRRCMVRTRRFGRRTGYACRLTIVSETNNKLATTPTSILSAPCTYVRTIIMLKKSTHVLYHTASQPQRRCAHNTRSALVHPAGRQSVSSITEKKNWMYQKERHW
jgi:hypothetical protein